MFHITNIYFTPDGHASTGASGWVLCYYCAQHMNYAWLGVMPSEPVNKRAVCFFDGQNLFHSAKAAFGYTYPNFNVKALAEAICKQYGWSLAQARFYTGVPDVADSAHWNHFWTAKGAQMGREGVVVFTRPLKYRNKEVRLPDGSRHTFLDGDEKGPLDELSGWIMRL